MEYRRLGHTDLNVSRIGFGCWAIGGHGYGKVDDRESIKAIRKALDLGINLFDTADVYGFGHSEKVLGKALGSRKDEVVIATKFGVNWNADGKTFKDCNPKRVQAALEASLRRLAVDCISLYQIHWYDGKTALYDLMEVLEKCKRDGKIRYIGCSNFSTDLITDLCVRRYRLESLQLPYNLLDKGAEEALQYSNRALNMGIIVYSVLARGFLSGKYDAATSFGLNDTRSHDRIFLPGTSKRQLRLTNVLREMGNRYRRTASQLAIRWVLEKDDITTAIVGAKNASQVAENAGAIGWRIDAADYRALNLIADMDNVDVQK